MQNSIRAKFAKIICAVILRSRSILSARIRTDGHPQIFSKVISIVILHWKLRSELSFENYLLSARIRADGHSQIFSKAISIVILHMTWSSVLSFENFLPFPRTRADGHLQIFSKAITTVIVHRKWSSELTCENFLPGLAIMATRTPQGCFSVFFYRYVNKHRLVWGKKKEKRNRDV